MPEQQVPRDGRKLCDEQLVKSGVCETCQGLDRRHPHAQGPRTLCIPRGKLWSDLAAELADCRLPGRAARRCPHPEAGLKPLQAKSVVIDGSILHVRLRWHEL